MDLRQSLDRISPDGPVGSDALQSNDVVSVLSSEAPRVGDDLPHVNNIENDPMVDNVLQSDLGVNTLLTRLKQSIASAREFANFLKKRSTLEEDQAQGLKKLCRGSHESTRRPENRQGSYAQNYEEMIRIHDRMADNGVQFSLSLHQMHEDLHDLAGNMERGRKIWKQNGLTAEKRVQDAETLMDKARAKYNTLAEDYDRARTGDKGTGRVFGLKGPKSAAQHEEDLQRKVQQADSDYSSKVQSAISQRQELVSTLRPQAVRALQELIIECDSGLTLQLQKFASYNERLLLGNGLCVSPLQGQQDGQTSQSLREFISHIDNNKDLNTYIASHATKVVSTGDIKYERHPTLVNIQATPAGIPRSQPPPQIQTPAVGENTQFSHSVLPQTQPSFAGIISAPGFIPTSISQNPPSSSPRSPNFPPSGPSGPPQLPPAPSFPPPYSQAPPSSGASNHDQLNSSLPVVRPVFGVSLDDLLKRDGSAIPLVVYQCVQAVDLFGLEVEGIYRLSGSSAQINKLKGLFDSDSGQVDFRNPEAFFHDVNSVAGLLKQFFRELPDPLLTREHYQSFIEAARIDDNIMRRDSMHATINALPDPNYATLRALTLHLNRVQERSIANRMNSGNLAIIYGQVDLKAPTQDPVSDCLSRPTLMGQGSNVADSGYQVKAIDTILQNTYQIFDDD